MSSYSEPFILYVRVFNDYHRHPRLPLCQRVPAASGLCPCMHVVQPSRGFRLPPLVSTIFEIDSARLRVEQLIIALLA